MRIITVAVLLTSVSLASPVWAQYNCVDDVLPVSIERARLDHALSYDSVRRVIVMVGGSSDHENSPRETWDGTVAAQKG